MLYQLSYTPTRPAPTDGGEGRQADLPGAEGRLRPLAQAAALRLLPSLSIERTVSAATGREKI